MPDGWQVIAYRGPQGTTAGAGTLLPLATAGATPPLLYLMVTASIAVMLDSAALATAVVMPAVCSQLVTRVAGRVSELKVSLLMGRVMSTFHEPVCMACCFLMIQDITVWKSLIGLEY